MVIVEKPPVENTKRNYYAYNHPFYNNGYSYYNEYYPNNYRQNHHGYNGRYHENNYKWNNPYNKRNNVEEMKLADEQEHVFSLRAFEEAEFKRDLIKELRRADDHMELMTEEIHKLKRDIDELKLGRIEHPKRSTMWSRR